MTDNAFYPSDQANFRVGAAVAAFNKTKRGILYVDKIHTNKYTVYRRENIDLPVNGSVKLSQLV